MRQRWLVSFASLPDESLSIPLSPFSLYLSLLLPLSLPLSLSLSVALSAFDLSDLTVTFVGRTRFCLLKYTKFLSQVEEVGGAQAGCQAGVTLVTLVTSHARLHSTWCVRKRERQLLIHSPPLHSTLGCCLPHALSVTFLNWFFVVEKKPHQRRCRHSQAV